MVIFSPFTNPGPSLYVKLPPTNPEIANQLLLNDGGQTLPIRWNWPAGHSLENLKSSSIRNRKNWNGWQCTIVFGLKNKSTLEKCRVLYFLNSSALEKFFLGRVIWRERVTITMHQRSSLNSFTWHPYFLWVHVFYKS